MKNYPKSVSKQCHEKISEQMNNFIYQIKDMNGKLGTGFFCKIKYKNNKIPVFITSYQIINEKYIFNNNSIEVSLNKNNISIEFELTKYINIKYGLSVIEIKQNETEEINYIEIDTNIYKNQTEDLFKKQSFYIIHCKKEKNELEKYVSYGIIDYMNNSKLKLLCNIDYNLNVNPIFNISNNALIGLFKSNDTLHNDGIFLKYIINEFRKR